MNQVILTAICFLAGLCVAFLFFKIKWKQTGSELNSKLDRLLTAGTLKLSPAASSVNFDAGIEGLSRKLENLVVEEKKEIKPASTDNSKDKVQELKSLLDNSRIVNELGQQVTSSLKLEDSFHHLFNTINSIMDAAVFELGIFHWRENRWHILSNLKSNDSYRNYIAEWAMKNNREVILEDAQNDYARYVFEAPVTSDGRKPASLISFPVLRHDKEVGALTIMSFNKKAFNVYHMDMIRSLIPYTAVAVGNALIHEELINTQTQLIHNEKMASLGQIASGIAHEILNPLNFVNNFSQLSREIVPELDISHSIEEQKELKDQLVSNLDKIHFHGQRAYGIVKNMMLLSRSGTGEKSKIDVNRSVEGFLNMAYNGFQSKHKGFECRIEKIFDSKLPEIDIVGNDFGSVLLNLFNNAFYTMNEKYKKLSAGIESLKPNFDPELVVKTSLLNQNLIISVRDNGMGIPEEIQSKIFLPFFTTKPTGEGTGLGLSISHDIITKGNKGELTVKSEIGKGSEFTIKLPLNAL